jgi:hypothetical protein
MSFRGPQALTDTFGGQSSFDRHEIDYSCRSGPRAGSKLH